MSPAYFFCILAVFTHHFHGQSDPFSAYSFKNVNATDISSTVAPTNSTLAVNNFACMHMCLVDSNCVLVAFKSANNNCSFYNSSAQSKTVDSAGSILYQKQINGFILFSRFFD
jgi:hypothetical protein